MHTQRVQLRQVEPQRQEVEPAEVIGRQRAGDVGVLRLRVALAQLDDARVVVAQHREPAKLTHARHHAERVGALGRQVADEHQPVVTAEAGGRQQVAELVVTAVHVSDEERAPHGQTSDAFLKKVCW